MVYCFVVTTCQTDRPTNLLFAIQPNGMRIDKNDDVDDDYISTAATHL